MEEVYNFIIDNEEVIKEDTYDTFPTYKKLIYDTYNKNHSKSQLIRCNDSLDTEKWRIVKLIPNCTSTQDFETIFSDMNFSFVREFTQTSMTLLHEFVFNDYHIQQKHLKQIFSSICYMLVENIGLAQLGESLGSLIKNVPLRDFVPPSIELLGSKTMEHIISMKEMPTIKFKDIIISTRWEDYYNNVQFK